jgi:hypothetical protein
MKVEVFTLCDAATADHSGKLNLLGAFDTLFAPQAPLVHPSCAVALRLRFDLPAHSGRHTLELRLADSDGKAILPPMKGELELPTQAEPRSHSRNIIINIQQLQLPTFGEYTIDLFINGRQLASTPLYANPLKR